MADEWKYMKAREGISGKEGTLYATVNNQVIPVMECKSITAKITKNKTSTSVIVINLAHVDIFPSNNC